MADTGDFMRVTDGEASTSSPSYQGLRFAGMFDKITCFIADENRSKQELASLLADLKANKVALLVRASRNNFDSRTLHQSGITLFNIPYRISLVPRETLMESLFYLLENLLIENRRVGVVFQGRTLAPFLIGFAMMIVGRNREDSVEKIMQLEGNPSEWQLRYLLRREYELKQRYIQTRSRRKRANPFARLFYYFVDKF